uniref:Uncharacterized protein n=1 Tax=Pararge aegeria TaxID=116150 RepID=S4P048_9NEOP
MFVHMPKAASFIKFTLKCFIIVGNYVRQIRKIFLRTSILLEDQGPNIEPLEVVIYIVLICQNFNSAI